MSTFWDMGGYAGYVWTTYGLAVIVMGGLWLSARAFQHRQETALRALEQAVDTADGENA